MGKLKKKKREIPLSLFYLKYFSYMIISVCLVGVFVFIAFVLLFSSDMIYPANYAQEQINLVYDELLYADEIRSDMIPKLCDYIVFDLEGKKISGNIDGKGEKDAWNVAKGENVDSYGYFYKVVPREKEYCVLRYQLIPQYKSEFMQKYFLPPETTILIVSLILILLSIAFVAIRFGKTLKKKLNSIIQATEKIQNQELDFSIEEDNIKELNTVLRSINNMRVALKESLEKQWKMEQLRKEQISALAHDLKTPLTLIRGNAELLQDLNLTDDQGECVQYIEASSLQMQNYVQMLIEVTKSDSLFKVRLSEVEIDSFLQNIKKQAMGLCTVKNIKLQWNCRIQTQKMSMDFSLMERAINNIMANAIEHTPVGGTIIFEVREEDDNIIFVITDSGKGFTEEGLKHATEQFYMGDSSRSTKSHYGMGLYIADTITKQHNGFLILENSKDVKGAKVTLKLPMQIFRGGTYKTRKIGKYMV